MKNIDYGARGQKTRATKIKNAGGLRNYLKMQRINGSKGGRSATHESNLRKGFGSATREQRQEWGRLGGLATRKETLQRVKIDYEEVI